MANQSATVLLSGGIDSAACAYLLRARSHPVRGVFIDYGQTAAARERHAAEVLAARLRVPLLVHVVSGTNCFGGGELVGRNAFLIFTALCLSRCHSGLLAIGIHAGTPYYDCSPPFLEAMARLVAEHTDGALALAAPFLRWSKAEVIAYFRTTGLPVDATYSCESGAELPCGSCASCRDRQMLGC